MEFETPDMEEIAIQVLKHLVTHEDFIGTNANDVFGMMEEHPYRLEDATGIVVQRRGGFLSEGFTEIAGLEVLVFAGTEREAKRVASLARNAFVNIEGKNVAARSMENDEIRNWLIDFVEVLDGPEYENTDVIAEHQRIMKVEIHSRVYWP